VEQRIGPYVIEDELGRGGMGVVYLARDPGLGRRVALKVLRRSSPKARQRLLIEARASAAIRHPNVVHVHDVRELEGSLVLVMDYVEGTNLGQRLATQGTIPPLEAARLATDLARALAAGHGRRILHRDVKPDNVLLRAHDGSALLTDFGLAKFQDEAQGMTQSGTLMGTPLYASPEQLTAQPLDARSDVYSLGALLYTMLTGEPPISGDSLVQIVAKVCGEEPPPPSSRRPDVPPWLDAICLQCLAKDPADRFPSAGALAQALQHGAQAPQSTVSRATPVFRPGKLTVAALIACGLVVIGVGAAVGLGGRAVRDDSRLTALLEPPSEHRPLDLSLPAWTRRGVDDADPRLSTHVAARTALLAGDAPPAGEGPDLELLHALGQLGWGHAPLSPDPEGWASARAQLERIAEGPPADPWSAWASAGAARALDELEALDRRVLAAVDARARGHDSTPVRASPWSSLERAQTRRATRARGLELLRELRASTPPQDELTPAVGKEVVRILERLLSDTRATTPAEREEFVAWLRLLVAREGEPRSWEEYYGVLPQVIGAIGPRVVLSELPDEVRLGLWAAVDVVNAGFVLADIEPSDDFVLLGPRVGLWPEDRLLRMRDDLVESYGAMEQKTGEHALALFVQVKSDLNAGWSKEVGVSRILDLIAATLGDDLPPAWREELEIPPSPPLAQPVSPCWVPYLRFRVLSAACRRDLMSKRELSPQRLDFYLEAFRESLDATRRSGVEPRLALIDAPKEGANALAGLADAHPDHAPRLNELAEKLWAQAHADVLEAVGDPSRVLESQQPELREQLLEVTVALTRWWVEAGELEQARELVDATLEAWELWDPVTVLPALDCWILALSGDPEALAACERERARLAGLPTGSAIRPSTFRQQKAQAEALLLAAELWALLDAGELEAAEARAQQEAEAATQPLVEVHLALKRLRQEQRRR